MRDILENRFLLRVLQNIKIITTFQFIIFKYIQTKLILTLNKFLENKNMEKA